MDFNLFPPGRATANKMVSSLPSFISSGVPLCLLEWYEISPSLPIFPLKSYPYLNVPLILPLGVIGMAGPKSSILSWSPSLQISAAGGWYVSDIFFCRDVRRQSWESSLPG